MTQIQIKIPKQTRSKALVESILNSCAEILLSVGMKAMTTNHIAEHAEVNIASIYQYFPNKESIVAKLIERHVDEEIDRISKVITNILKNASPHEGLLDRENIRLIIKEFIDVHIENLELTKILHMQVSHVACRHVLRNATQLLTSLIEKLLDNEPQFKNQDNSIRAYIITQSVDSLIQTTLIEHDELFAKPVFLDELVTLCMKYLH